MLRKSNNEKEKSKGEINKERKKCNRIKDI